MTQLPPMPDRALALIDPAGDYVIKIEGDAFKLFADDQIEFVTYCNVDFMDRGLMLSDRDPWKALRFKNAGDAMEFWKLQSRTQPFRPDGMPNRPLTAMTVSIEKLTP